MKFRHFLGRSGFSNYWPLELFCVWFFWGVCFQAVKYRFFFRLLRWCLTLNGLLLEFRMRWKKWLRISIMCMIWMIFKYKSFNSYGSKMICFKSTWKLSDLNLRTWLPWKNQASEPRKTTCVSALISAGPCLGTSSVIFPSFGYRRFWWDMGILNSRVAGVRGCGVIMMKLISAKLTNLHSFRLFELCQRSNPYFSQKALEWFGNTLEGWTCASAFFFCCGSPN